MTVSSANDLVKLMILLARVSELRLFIYIPLGNRIKNEGMRNYWMPGIEGGYVEGRDSDQKYKIHTFYDTMDPKLQQLWEAWEPALKGVKVSDYRPLGDIVMREGDWDWGYYVLAHKSICKEVPLKTIVNFRDGDKIRVPDWTKFDYKYYTPIGAAIRIEKDLPGHRKAMWSSRFSWRSSTLARKTI